MNHYYLQIEDFMPEYLHNDLLSYVDRHASEFTNSDLSNGNDLYHNDTVRKSLLLRSFPEIKPKLKEQFAAILPRVQTYFGISEPKLNTEIEIVATQNGGFFSRHVDTITGNTLNPFARVITAVYYFHTQPKAFNGGALRIYSLHPAAQKEFIDIEPKDNSAIFFPAFIPHQVLPVTIPSTNFMDSRFSVNCWFNKALD